VTLFLLHLPAIAAERSAAARWQWEDVVAVRMLFVVPSVMVDLPIFLRWEMATALLHTGVKRRRRPAFGNLAVLTRAAVAQVATSISLCGIALALTSASKDECCACIPVA
jgi:hypothetical protein